QPIDALQRQRARLERRRCWTYSADVLRYSARRRNVAGRQGSSPRRHHQDPRPGVPGHSADRRGRSTRIRGVAVQPTPSQRAALDELKDASVTAAEALKVSCPAYQMLTPTGRAEAMEKRLNATLGAVKTVQPALAKFYNSLSDEQKARFNSLRSASRPAG